MSKKRVQPVNNSESDVLDRMPKQKYCDPSRDSEMDYNDTVSPRHEVSKSSHNLSSVSVNNRYLPLQDIGDKEVPNNHSPKPSSTKKVKIPLITLTELSLPDAHGKILHSGVSIFNTKRTSSGINVYVYSTGDYKMLIDHLKKQKVHFFTYVLDEEKTTKIVLSGLHDMEVDDVASALVKVEVKPFQIRKMMLKKQKYTDHALYLLYFRKGSIQINDLRKIKSVHHSIVNWEYYSRKNNVPIQCHNCQMFGHGSTHCFRPPRCVKCGETHSTEKCPLTANRSSKEDKLSQEVLKCANCKLNHTANYSECAKRIEFIKARSSINQRKVSTKNTFMLRQDQFPSLEAKLSTKIHDAQQPECSYASKVRSGLSPLNRVQQAGMAYTNTNHSFRTNIGSDLFSHSEVVQIINDSFAKLSVCRTKQDQVKVILEIISFYCFPHDG